MYEFFIQRHEMKMSWSTGKPGMHVKSIDWSFQSFCMLFALNMLNSLSSYETLGSVSCNIKNLTVFGTNLTKLLSEWTVWWWLDCFLNLFIKLHSNLILNCAFDWTSCDLFTEIVNKFSWKPSEHFGVSYHFLTC